MVANLRAKTHMHSTSTWFALRNPTFLRIWMATVFSATFLSAQDVTATWLLHDLGASFSLSLMATATSTPLLLFALPAGIVADKTNRRNVILSAMAWQAAFTGLLAFGAWTKTLSINSVLLCVFALGIGIAFGAPVWSAIVPSIVSKEELSSAVTLGGVQVNIAGIVGPALGGFILPTLGAPLLLSINAVIFFAVCLVILRWRPDQATAKQPDQGVTESFVESIRYAARSYQIKIILFRNLLFSLAIAAVPALLPVIIYTELKGSAGQLGLAFTCVAAGSLAGAVIVLPFLRQRLSPNGITLVAMAIMPVVLAAMAFLRTSSTMLGLFGCRWCRLGAGGIRALACRSARGFRQDPRPDEFVSDYGRTSRHSPRLNPAWRRCSACGSWVDPGPGRGCGSSGFRSRVSLFNQFPTRRCPRANAIHDRRTRSDWLLHPFPLPDRRIQQIRDGRLRAETKQEKQGPTRKPHFRSRRWLTILYRLDSGAVRRH